MSRTTTPVAGGTTGSLADSAPAIDRVSGADYQMVKLADATTDATSATGVAANPLKVKELTRGTQVYDSGGVAVTNGAPASVTATTIYPKKGFISNTSNAVRLVTVVDGSDVAIATIELAPYASAPLPAAGTWAGFKAGANGTGVILVVEGEQ